MDIPVSCNSLVEKIKRSSDKERLILNNILIDIVVPRRVAKKFLSKFATKVSSLSSYDAINIAKDIIKSDTDFFTCKGPTISDKIFILICRIEPGSLIKYRIPESERETFLRRYGLTSNTPFNGVPKSVIKAIVTDLVRGQIELGNSIGIVWVTDMKEVEPIISNVQEAIDRLGLDNFDNEKVAGIIIYERNKLKHALHIPTILDAIDFPRFQTVCDRNASAGKTLPLTKPPEYGLPEAVHRKCKLSVTSFEVRSLV